MSQFAREQMLLSGWKEGRGLGKNEDGMAEPIKVKIKADNAGVGHDPGEQYTFHWWEHVFAKSADNINVVESENGVKVEAKRDTERVSTKREQRRLENKKMLYGCFVKSGVLENGKVTKEEEKDSSSSDSDSEQELKRKVKPLTDEELLAACGGRTAHKGARHGVNLGGKLARLMEQEKNNHAASSAKKNIKRKPKNKKEKNKIADVETCELKTIKRCRDVGGDDRTGKKNRKKKKKKELRDKEKTDGNPAEDEDEIEIITAKNDSNNDSTKKSKNKKPKCDQVCLSEKIEKTKFKNKKICSLTDGNISVVNTQKRKKKNKEAGAKGTVG